MRHLRARYLYCLGSLGDLMISPSPTLSSPPSPPESPAARFSAADASAWTEPRESAAGTFLDLFVCGILGRDDDTVALRADSRVRPETKGQLAVTGNLVLSTATHRVSLKRAMMKALYDSQERQKSKHKTWQDQNNNNESPILPV